MAGLRAVPTRFLMGTGDCSPILFFMIFASKQLLMRESRQWVAARSSAKLVSPDPQQYVVLYFVSFRVLLWIALGGRRGRPRPRMRSADDERELPVGTYDYFADRDPLTQAVMDRMLAGVSTRRFAAVGEPVGTKVAAESTATSRAPSQRCLSSARGLRWRS